MVVVLDKNATPFTRIWCGFEQATVVQGKKLLLDFATVDEGEAQLLTEGLAASDNRSAERKMRRELDFPIDLIETGYSKIRIQDSEASVPDDKTRILDSIAANAADREDAFDRVNRELRAMLAEPALNQSARKGSLQKAMDVLCADTHRTKVTVDLSYCSQLSDLTPLRALGHLQNLNQLTSPGG